MADDNKQPGTILAIAGVILIALLAVGALYFHRETPLLSSRPTTVEANISELTARQNQKIAARLWQDPFAAVTKSLDKSSLRELEKRCQEKPINDNACKSPLAEKDTLVIGVTVLGGPDDAEHRRRTRYAVLAGLNRAGFIPRDAHRIGYFLWPLANEDAAIVPYEWFQPRGLTDENSDEFGAQDILVMWLNEADLKGQPFARLSSLIRKVRGYDGGNCVSEDGKNFRIIGPFSSDLLHDMVIEARAFAPSCRGNDAQWPQLKNVQFFAYGASAPDGALEGIPTKTYTEIERFFKIHKINLHRMVASDDTLAGGIVKELERRLDASRPHFGPGQEEHIALVSEWDTFYGQTLPEAVKNEFKSRGLPAGHAHEFTYLRGLDGRLLQAEDTQKNNAGAQGEIQTALGEKASENEADAETSNRPFGQGQYDYLRRLSEQLRHIDDKLRNQQHAGKLRAIGVLGSDVFDKLLILRALRPQFPEAVFFTTDFDEDYTIKSELPYTRNLIISSSFGPNLSETFQKHIPLFRDTYQSSAFLSTLAAIGDPANEWKTSEIFAESIAEQLKAPRIFEIKRSGDVLAFAWDIPPSALRPPGAVRPPLLSGNVARSKKCWRDDDPAKCGYIQPVDVEEQQKLEDAHAPKIMDTLYPTFEERSSQKLAWGLVLGAVLSFSLLAFRTVRKNAAFEVLLASFVLGVAAWTCYHWEHIAQYLTEHGKGEPIAMLDGISVWPTVLLRVFGIVLAVCFIRRVMCGLNENLKEIADELKLESQPASLWKQFWGVFEDILSTWKKIRNYFHSSGGSNPADPSPFIDAEVAWKVYVGHERFWPRCLRALLYTYGMFAIGALVLAPIFGMPMNPARGIMAVNWYFGTTMAYVLLMQFLTFFILDATMFCLLFVNNLRRAQTLWPAATMEIYDGRLQMQTQLVHDWIDLDFVAKRTNFIGSLVYYPFMLIALLIVSHSTLFANYTESPTILVMQGWSLAILFYSCAIALWQSAEGMQDTVKKNLTEGIIRAKNSDGDGLLAEQLEQLLNSVDQLKEGAFRPLLDQPLIRGVLLPVGGLAWTMMTELAEPFIKNVITP